MPVQVRRSDAPSVALQEEAVKITLNLTESQAERLAITIRNIADVGADDDDRLLSVVIDGAIASARSRRRP